MAYLRIQRKGNASYYLILKSERRQGRVVQKVLEYLGRDPDPSRLRRALEYWGVAQNSSGPRESASLPPAGRG